MDTHKLTSLIPESIKTRFSRPVSDGRTDKDNAFEKLKEARERYERLCQKSNGLIERLYSVRKEAALQISAVERALLSNPSVDSHSVMAVEQARNKIRQFEDYVELESSRSNGYGAIPVVGATVSSAISTLGMGTGVALITAFGVSRIDRLLSSFSIAELPGRALSWLGKGVLSASSVGIAAGAALMALAGPIGETTEKDDDKTKRQRTSDGIFASRINSQVSEIEEKCDAIEACCNRIGETIASIRRDMAALNDSVSSGMNNQYESVSLVLNLVSSINRKFSV